MTSDPSHPVQQWTQTRKTTGMDFCLWLIVPAIGYRWRLIGKTDQSVDLYCRMHTDCLPYRQLWAVWSVQRSTPNKTWNKHIEEDPRNMWLNLLDAKNIAIACQAWNDITNEIRNPAAPKAAYALRSFHGTGNIWSRGSQDNFQCFCMKKISICDVQTDSMALAHDSDSKDCKTVADHNLPLFA